MQLKSFLNFLQRYIGCFFGMPNALYDTNFGQKRARQRPGCTHIEQLGRRLSGGQLMLRIS